MKTHWLNKMVVLFLILTGWTAVYGQVSQSEVPGDHFSLEGALELFKKSASPEEFEQLLNSSSSKVNNLDLNGDGDVDYIKVIDKSEGNVHAFILQAIISHTERQDVAVIELEKLANGKAVLQITGDADVYGIETIIEPTEEVRINAGTSTARSVVNVWAWPSVQYIYSPYYYSTWNSPWGWSMRPTWWSPWRQVAYYEYNPWWQPYRPYYSVCYTHRVIYAQHIYRPHRTTSIVVHNRHHTQIEHYRSSRDNNNSYGRNKYSEGRSNDHRSGSTDRPDTNGRTRTTSQNGRSEKSSNDWSQSQGNQDLTKKRSYDNRSTSNSGSRPSSGSDSRVNTSQRTWERQDNRPNGSQKTWERQQTPDVSRKLSTPGNRNDSHPQVTRPANEQRTYQKPSTVQQNPRGSSTSPSIQRSGGSESKAKSSGTKRGRQ